MVHTKPDIEVNKSFLNFFIVSLLIGLAFGQIAPVASSDGEGEPEDWACTIFREEEYASEEGEEKVILECEEDETGELINCQVDKDGVECDQPSMQCESIHINSDNIVFVACGSPVNVTCGIAEDGTGECNGIDVPQIDVGEPTVVAPAANIFDSNCFGIWGEGTKGAVGTHSDPTGKDVRANDLMVGETKNVHSGYQMARANDDAIYEELGFLMPGIVYDGKLGDEAEEACPWCVGVAVTLILWGFDKMHDALEESSMPEERDIFPTVDWTVLCSGYMGLDGKCNGSVLLEERVCVFVTRQGSSQETYKELPARCRYNYLDQNTLDFPTSCEIAEDLHLTHSPDRFKGVFEPGDREVPETIDVCWKEGAILKLQNKAANDWHGIYSRAEDLMGYDPEEVAHLSGDCPSPEVQWEILTWLECWWMNDGSDTGRILEWEVYYDPNTGELDNSSWEEVDMCTPVK